MRLKLSYLIIAFLFVANYSCQNQNDRYTSGIKYASEFVKEAANDKNYKPFYDTLISDCKTAISVVEPILFKIYGKSNIEAEKPYECYLVNGFWYIAGTLSNGSKGGVFEIVIEAKDGKVIKLVHGK